MTFINAAATCRHCKKVITAAITPIIGEKPLEAQARVVQVLANHLGQCNQGALVGAVLDGAKLQGYIILSQFQFGDEKALEEFDSVRFSIHNATRRVIVPDASIRHRVKQMQLDPQTEEAVVKVVCEMRDILMEAGMHPAAESSEQLAIDRPTVTQ